MNPTNFRSGYIYIFLCCITNAVSFVFMSHLNKTHNEMLSIFMTFGYAILIFNLFNIKNIRKIYRLVFQNKIMLLRMNIITLLNWLSTFMILRYFDPATAFCLIIGVLTVTVFFISTPLNQLKRNKHLGASVLLVLVSMALVIYQYYLHRDLSTLQTKNMLFGIAWCLLCGITGAFIGFSSEAMGKVSFSITQILATRFYFLALFGGIAILLTHQEAIHIDWGYYLLSSVIIVFFPLLMFQAAIRELGTMLVSLLEPFSPVFTYILQVAVGDYQFHMGTILILLLLSAAIVWFVRIEQNIRNKKIDAELNNCATNVSI